MNSTLDHSSLVSLKYGSPVLASPETPSDPTPPLPAGVNAGKRKDRSIEQLRPDVFVISAESLDDPRHLLAVVGPKR
ncbi:MAG: hypothetical protein M3R38_34930, partial [Actinomycetota bacterium]|nr:hypothetical protein [Actinomycetota bacterium]